MVEHVFVVACQAFRAYQAAIADIVVAECGWRASVAFDAALHAVEYLLHVLADCVDVFLVGCLVECLHPEFDV